MMRLKLAVLIMAILCASASVFASPVVFSNPYDFNSVTTYTSGNFQFQFQTLADYDYDGSFSITDFHWWGLTVGVDTGFRFEIWQDDGNGVPGTNVYTESIVGNAGATAVGDQIQGYEVYKYGFDLTTPFSGAVGKYWFSVVSESADGWGWALSASRLYLNDLQYVGTIGGGGTIIPGNPQENDFAFELTGDRTVVPEPATMTLFGLGLLGSALAARRSKNKNQKDV